MSVATPIRRPEALPVDTWPQVNLLPAEVTRGRRLRSLKKLLVLALALVLLIATLGYAGALYLANRAADQLAAEQAENQDLLGQKAEYAEVPATLSAIAMAEMARQQAMAPEIVWPDYLEALRAVTPEGVSYDSMSVAVATPGQSYAGSTNPLAGTTIGQVTFSARSTTLPDTAAWIESIEGVSGLANPWFSSASLTEEEGVVFYQVSASVDLLPSALAGRFEPEVAP
jgi:Tfp pilus assembly protein PilN